MRHDGQQEVDDPSSSGAESDVGQGQNGSGSHGGRGSQHEGDGGGGDMDSKRKRRLELNRKVMTISNHVPESARRNENLNLGKAGVMIVHDCFVATLTRV